MDRGQREKNIKELFLPKWKLSNNNAIHDYPSENKNHIKQVIIIDKC